MSKRDEIRAYVRKCYLKVLKREPDEGGWLNYTILIETGQIQHEQLPTLLATSPEYRLRFGNRPPSEPASTIHIKTAVKSSDDLVSIIVLNYNTLEVLKPCITSICANTVHPYELIIVDNGSMDGSVEWAKECNSIHVVIENNWNFGWAKANNIGMKNAKGTYFLLLNNDTVVLNRGWLSKMLKCFSDPSVGTVGAKLLYPNGTIQHVGGGIKGTHPYHPYDKSPDTIPHITNRNREVPFVTGACVLIKRSTIEKVGWLDESFYFGFDDVDYGLRVVMAGLKNVYCCNAVLTHHWAYTQRKTRKFIGSDMLNLYHRKWNDKLPEIGKRVKLTW